MDGIMGHVKEERLLVFLGLVHGREGFLGESFGKECARAPVLSQAGNGESRRGSAVLAVAVVALTEVGGRRSTRMSCDIDIESPCRWVLSGRIHGTPMGLAAVYGMVAIVAQNLHEGTGVIGVFGGAYGRNAVYVPLRHGHLIVIGVGHDVSFQRPVCHSVAGGDSFREETTTCRRAVGGGGCLGEKHALEGQILHVWGLAGKSQEGR